MDARQLKMARVALGLTVRQAAEVCAVSHDTITRIEAGQDLKSSTIDKVQAGLEAAGVEFIPENGGGAGVRLRKVSHVVHVEEGTQRLLFRRASGPLPPGRWAASQPLRELPKLAKLNEDGWFILEEPSEEERERALRWYPSAGSDHPKPTVPATDVVDKMDAAIEGDRAQRRR